MLKRFASNAGANLLSGVVTASYQLALVGIASRIWQGSDFAAWGLALSVATICQLFSANLSSVVTRRVVAARHGSNPADEAPILKAATRLAGQLTALAVGVLLTIGGVAHHLSTAVTLTLPNFLSLLLLLLASQIWTVLLQTRFGLHYANENNWMPAITMAAARLGGLAGFAIGIYLANEQLLAGAAGLMTGTMLALFVVQNWTRSVDVATTATSSSEVQRQYRENLKVFAGFAVWAMGAFVIQFSIPPLMAVIEPNRFNAFYLASTLNMIALGSLSAAMSALLAPLSRWHAVGEGTPLRRLILLGPIFCTGGSAFVLVVAWYGISPMIDLLTSKAASVEDIRAFLALLGFQTIVRSAAMGYSVSLASAGSTRQMSNSIVLEIALTLLVATPMGWAFGSSALLLGLIIAGWFATIYTCLIGTSLSKVTGVGTNRALAIFITSQVAICLLWWALVKDAL